jgi:DNA-binding NtrC family response regulator
MNTVLLVDDNATLALFTARNLQKGIDGLNVVTAHSAAEARSVYEQHVPSVVIADVMLPDGNGMELIEEFRKQNPQVASIVISGNLPLDGQSWETGAFLLKPYEAEALVDAVKTALATNRGGKLRRVANPRRPADSPDFHRVHNRLAGLLAGLRSLEADLREQAQNPLEIRRILDEDLDRLCASVMEIAHMLPDRGKRS